MKLLITLLVLLPAAFAQTPSVPCIPPPAPAPAVANTPNQGRGRGPGRAAAQQSAADIAEIAKLMEFPAWRQHLAPGDYSGGPAFRTAPELARRSGVPEGKV